MRLLTWHVHGNYLYYLSQTPFQWYLPVDKNRSEGYGGKTPQFNWGSNVYEVPLEDIPNLKLDAIIFQSKRNYQIDQYHILTSKQRQLPTFYLEHDPPREHPTDTQHWVDDEKTTIIHVTHFNQLMWNNRNQPTTVIQHGVKLPHRISYKGDLDKGLVIINNIKERGRRLGLDVFLQARSKVPLDLIGMNSQLAGGLGEINFKALPEFMSHYRFIFSPIRYASLGLSLIEAMMIGLPLVGLATTELPSIIQNNINGYLSTNINVLIARMKELITNPAKALALSKSAKTIAVDQFNINRFIKDWEQCINKGVQSYAHRHDQRSRFAAGPAWQH